MAPRNTATETASHAIRLQLPEGEIEGDLRVPRGALGMVVFAHGSGSSRHSRRNRFVTDVLHEAGFGTLLFDLLTKEEDGLDQRTGELRFDIGLLGERLVVVTDWLLRDPRFAEMPIGYFGASTGAAATLVAAAEKPGVLRAVVSRGGRPDLAGAALPRVSASTLLIVGGEDRLVVELNRRALAQLGSAEKELVIVPGATHLFEESGALELVAQYASDWFTHYLKLPGIATTQTLDQTRG